MRVLRWDGGRVTSGGRELVEPGARLWIDCVPDAETLAYLGATFGFHPLALEDCANEGQRPKYEPYPESLFCVVHRVAPAPDESDIHSHELHAFLTAHALVTVHGVPIAEVDQVFARCAREAALLERGPDFALYLVHDALTDIHFALADCAHGGGRDARGRRGRAGRGGAGGGPPASDHRSAQGARAPPQAARPAARGLRGARPPGPAVRARRHRRLLP